MLSARIRYLRGSVTAADIRAGNDKSSIEWPLHPDRFFSALVRSWGDLGCPDPHVATLRWIEALPPPTITCGEVLHASIGDNYPTRFVPVNDEPTIVGRKRQRRLIPSAALSRDDVVLTWPAAAPESDQLIHLDQLTRFISNIGHSSSLVGVWVERDEAPAPPTWLPRQDGDILLRVPRTGRFDELCAAYAATPRRWPPIGAWAAYGPPQALIAAPSGYHREVFTFALTDGGFALPLEATPRVINVWRKALLQRAEQPVPEVISGHSVDSTPADPRPARRPHLALFPIADVGHPHARGHLLGLGASLPADLTHAERTACLRTLGRVTSLTLGGLGVWTLSRDAGAAIPRGLLPETWTRPSRVWASVTPVVFGRFPRRQGGDEAADIVREACMIAGLPAPLEVTTGPISALYGVPSAGRFDPLPSRPGKPQRWHAHARLVFPEPVRGPMLVGAGRHLGYGIFRQAPGGA